MSKRRPFTPRVQDSRAQLHVRWGSWECKSFMYKNELQASQGNHTLKAAYLLVLFRGKKKKNTTV